MAVFKHKRIQRKFVVVHVFVSGYVCVCAAMEVPSRRCAVSTQ